MGYIMISMAKILYFTGPILIIALLALLTSEQHYRESFYHPYLVINFLVFLIVWVGSTLALKISFAYPLPKGYFWKIAGAWSITSSISWLINHFILSGFLARSGSRPKFSIPILVLTWIFGLILVLGWFYGLALLKYIFTSSQLRWLKVGIEVVLSVLGLFLVIIVVINLHVRFRFRDRITSVDSVQSNATAIVFGAGVYQESGRPSLVLRDRIETAAELVEKGKSESVLLSGDGSAGSIEVDVMARHAVEIGIPESILVLDKSGYRTYETCSRACTEFGIRDALLVTQDFHLPRALLICKSVGLGAVGVRADRTRYSLLSHLIWALRESLATAYAWLEEMVNHK
ncbi:MAG TPA: hypothetical protein DF984_02070 [Anaerolineaceae bacterium]|nr:hypothetical protein [Anaerolineaceae bacterium]